MMRGIGDGQIWFAAGVGAALAPVLYPLPSAEDRASADAMAGGGGAMVEMARVMDDAVALMLGSDDAQLVALGEHWALDAQALRRQAAWTVRATSPKKAMRGGADPTGTAARAVTTKIDRQKRNIGAPPAEGSGAPTIRHGEEVVQE